jgi:hypothetical protein
VLIPSFTEDTFATGVSERRKPDFRSDSDGGEVVTPARRRKGCRVRTLVEHVRRVVRRDRHGDGGPWSEERKQGRRERLGLLLRDKMT